MYKKTPLLLRAIRLLGLSWYLLSGIIQSFVYPHVSVHCQRRMMKKWASGLLRVLNIKLRCHGKAPGIEIPRALLVANHVSWLDICVLMAVCPTRFVAKSEIATWPLLGLLCKNTGTLFIKRAKRNDTTRINQEIVDVLEAGERVALFPEGTTADGTYLNHFHASLLQSAVIADALVYPVSIGYKNSNDGVCLEAAYMDPSLVLSLQQILTQTQINTDLFFGDPIPSGTKNRRELARMIETTIAQTLSLPIRHKQPETTPGLPI